MREQFFLAAVAQNIKRLVRFLGRPTTPVLPATTYTNGDKKTGDGMLAEERRSVEGLFQHPRLFSSVIAVSYFSADSSMQILAVSSIAVLILAALLVAIFKGSRPPQPIPSTPTSPKQATFAAFISVVCAAILLVTFTSLGPYVSEHLAPPKPLVVLFVGGIVPWFVGVYFAYKAARARNRVLRAIGASEMLIFLSAATLSLLSR